MIVIPIIIISIVVVFFILPIFIPLMFMRKHPEKLADKAVNTADKIADGMKKSIEMLKNDGKVTVTCKYCGSTFLTDDYKCPNCGASNNK